MPTIFTFAFANECLHWMKIIIRIDPILLHQFSNHYTWLTLKVVCLTAYGLRLLTNVNSSIAFTSLLVKKPCCKWKKKKNNGSRNCLNISSLFTTFDWQCRSHNICDLYKYSKTHCKLATLTDFSLSYFIKHINSILVVYNTFYKPTQ